MTASEYLATDFDRPVPEFVKGEIVERGSGTFLHGHTIGRLGGLFGPLRVGAIVHVRTAVDTYRGFDVAVLEQQMNASLISSGPLLGTPRRGCPSSLAGRSQPSVPLSIRSSRLT